VRLSSSEYSKASTCFKLYEYSVVDRLAVKPNLVRDSMRLGTWIHRALEIYHQGGDWGNAVAELVNWAMEHGVDGEKAVALHNQVREIVEGYIAYWAPRAKWTAFVGEPALEVTVQGHTLSARLDSLVVEGGALYIVESKSTQEIPSAAWRCLDPQTALQWLVCKGNGLQVDGIIFNYLSTKVPPIPKWKKNGEPYATTLQSVTTARAFDQGLLEHVRMGVPYEVDLEQALTLNQEFQELRARIVHDGAYYQRYYVYKPSEAIVGILRDVASTIRDLEAAQKASHYRRLANLMYCPRFCAYSELCATELTTGRRSEVLRLEKYVHDDGVISREGVVR